jgi:hypothetical protein
MSKDTLELEHIPDGETADVQLCLATGAFMAIETVLRDRIADAVGEDCRRATVEVPLVAMYGLADFAEACRTQLEQHGAPAGRRFSNTVAEIVHLHDSPESPRTLIDGLARTRGGAAADSALPVLSWFACELGRVMACGMPQPPGTSDAVSRRAFFERSDHARWPIRSDSGDPN